MKLFLLQPLVESSGGGPLLALQLPKVSKASKASNASRASRAAMQMRVDAHGHSSSACARKQDAPEKKKTEEATGMRGKHEGRQEISTSNRAAGD